MAEPGGLDHRFRRAACIEMLYADAPDLAQRISRAAQDGFDAIEFWHWMNKDLAAIAAATTQNGMTVAGFLVEPVAHLADPAAHAGFLDALGTSLRVARQLGAPTLYTQSGHKVVGMSDKAMHNAICDVLEKAADILRDKGVVLLLEPVSDNPGSVIEQSAPGFDIVARVNRPEVRLLYDFYHANVLKENTASALARVDLIGHVHLADYPGRGAPGTGRLDIDGFLGALQAQGYRGTIGFEYRPEVRASI